MGGGFFHRFFFCRLFRDLFFGSGLFSGLLFCRLFLRGFCLGCGFFFCRFLRSGFPGGGSGFLGNGLLGGSDGGGFFLLRFLGGGSFFFLGGLLRGDCLSGRDSGGFFFGRFPGGRLLYGGAACGLFVRHFLRGDIPCFLFLGGLFRPRLLFGFQRGLALRLPLQRGFFSGRGRLSQGARRRLGIARTNASATDEEQSQQHSAGRHLCP